MSLLIGLHPVKDPDLSGYADSPFDEILEFLIHIQESKIKLITQLVLIQKRLRNGIKLQLLR